MKRVSLLVVGLLCFVIVFAQQPKYIFYIIGDGMGVNAVTLTEMYLAEIQGRIGTIKNDAISLYGALEKFLGFQ